MSNQELTKEQIQQLLDENTHLIKVILTCQNEGRIMDAMLYQTRFQLNLTQLAACADNHKHPSQNTPIPDSRSQAQITRFVRAANSMGFKDLNALADTCDIPLDKIGPIGVAYVAFLRRQNRFNEAQNLEKELTAQGFEIKQD
ncbi:hypothetical protein TVAG_309000 [Trichomonas vaginalis G3]|uniref:SS18 N-terminal domain-containing protein n=1 Tax=Trichomonas vaginalis (strain ATCC PRA-98 / G3) TaxID=412133 RepID=A2EDP6_TRIV3|nr:SSXT protein (N-terminal region) family [Trichomonas vaginalis G3]EAY09211.1 hypothetical protein TVAG_309000 [Trichomonas vaginalis G3]KAI5486792.1 SSXT protein (N-terminal region) family [Trichomonas vaginalis G3]|eukprot:XP_001321434.1 hypothetical protein [Trichomonas vaginalis G3]